MMSKPKTKRENPDAIKVDNSPLKPGDEYVLSINEVVDAFSSDSSNGLDEESAKKAEKIYGSNTLEEKKKKSLIAKIIDQFKDFMVLVLLVASGVSAVLGEYIDALVIVGIVVINAVLGIVQEGKAEKAIEALRKMSSPSAKVIRDGKLKTLPASQVVPGDICLVEAGDIIPADMRLIESSSLKIEEASLTGESVPVEKSATASVDRRAGIGDRLNMCYMSTAVTYGKGKGIVTAIGAETQIGNIATKLEDIRDENTPLQKNLNKLGKILGVICLGVCVLVFIHGVLTGGDILEVFMTAISLAVAAIPEGLPAVVTIVLALGMKRLANRNAIMKQLLAVETLGSVNVICTDKTGTLTRNEMTVTVAWVYDKEFSFTGSGYSPEGKMTSEKEEYSSSTEGEDAIDRLFQNAALCSDAVISIENNEAKLIGDPTEGAIIVAASKAGISVEDIREKFNRLGELPFDSERKMMTTFHKDPAEEKGFISFTKGASDVILRNCKDILTPEGVIPIDDLIKETILNVNSSFAGEALRVLGFSMNQKSADESEDAEVDMTFIGLMGMIDPEREEAKEAIAVCKNAGIRPIMITGDFMETAEAIAFNLGLASKKDSAVSGAQLDLASDEQMLEIVEEKSVYARVSPDHKVRIVGALRENGHITAMTGDGVNDAMALKKADIGVAMGITGTEVAKNTANMILTDDNFATIVSAVEEGRIIYGNIRKFVGFLLSCNVGEILVIFITSLLMGPKFVPLLPIQLLWLNLVTDSFPALALGTEKGEPGIMNEKPRDPNESIINKSMFRTITVQSIAIFIAVFAAFRVGMILHPSAIQGQPSVYARTFAFVTLISAELFRAFSSRSEHASVFKIGVFTNKNMNLAVLLSSVLVLAVVYIPFMQPIFSTAPIGLKDWGVILGFAIIPFIADEIHKLIKRIISRRKNK